MFQRAEVEYKEKPQVRPYEFSKSEMMYIDRLQEQAAASHDIISYQLNGGMLGCSSDNQKPPTR